jgi:chromosome segregation ATPase
VDVLQKQFQQEKKENEHKFRQMEERLCEVEKEKEKTVAEKNCEVAELKANCTEWKAQCREKDITIYNLKEALSTAMDTIDEQKHKIRELEREKCKANLELKHLQEEVPIKQVVCNTANKVKMAVGRVTLRQTGSLAIPVQATD